MLTSYDCIFMLLEVIYTLTVYKIINVFFTNKKINSVYEKILYAIFNIAVVAVYLKFNIPLLTIVANFIFILLLLSLIYDDTFKRKALVTTLIIFFLLISDVLLSMIFINVVNENILQKNNFFDIIEVFISYKDSNLLIKIVNTFDGLVIKDNKGFVSRKEEKAYHGIGLENVREQVEKSNGYMNIDTGNCMFTVDLFINL